MLTVIVRTELLKYQFLKCILGFLVSLVHKLYENYCKYKNTNLLVIRIGHDKDLIIGYHYQLKFFILCIPSVNTPEWPFPSKICAWGNTGVAIQYHRYSKNKQQPTNIAGHTSEIVT